MTSIYVRVPRELEVLMRGLLGENTPRDAISLAGELIEQLEAFCEQLVRDVDDTDLAAEARRLARRLQRG